MWLVSLYLHPASVHTSVQHSKILFHKLLEALSKDRLAKVSLVGEINSVSQIIAQWVVASGYALPCLGSHVLNDLL